MNKYYSLFIIFFSAGAISAEEGYKTEMLQHGVSMLTSGDAQGQAVSITKGKVTGAANDAVTDFLGSYGSAAVNLNLDDDFSLDGSSVDWLIPLYDQGENLLFSQIGFRNKDRRNTINTGVGWRHFDNSSMVGTNYFFDNDLSGKNKRHGVGLEYGRDYLNMSSNAYFRLSDWHQSRDFENYEERPANGYDIRLNGYLPQHPELGLSLSYEKYYGDDVALFGKNDKQSNPYALTVGASYSPFSLIKTELSHSRGKHDVNDTSLSLTFNYLFSVPFVQQLSSDYIDTARTLAGSRYNLVQRNNDIVLEYRKKADIKLYLPKVYTGLPNSTFMVMPVVNSTYPLSKIEWDYSALLQVGGTVELQSDNGIMITLPGYNVESDNTYRIYGTAVDSKGNRSGKEQTDITVIKTPGNGNGSLTLTVNNGDTFVEGGEIPMTVSLVGDDGNPLPNEAISLVVVSALDRQGNPRSDTGPLLIDGKPIGEETLTTDSLGRVSFKVTDPNGIGVKTTIAASHQNSKSEANVIFRIISSPDSTNANMWGHMGEKFGRFKRPLLINEVRSNSSSIDIIRISNESYALTNVDTGRTICSIPASFSLFKEAYEQNGIIVQTISGDGTPWIPRSGNYKDLYKNYGWPSGFYLTEMKKFDQPSPDGGIPTSEIGAEFMSATGAYAMQQTIPSGTFMSSRRNLISCVE